MFLISERHSFTSAHVKHWIEKNVLYSRHHPTICKNSHVELFIWANILPTIRVKLFCFKSEYYKQMAAPKWHLQRWARFWSHTIPIFSELYSALNEWRMHDLKIVPSANKYAFVFMQVILTDWLNKIVAVNCVWGISVLGGKNPESCPNRNII